MIRHELRAGGAVEADGKQIGMAHGCVKASAVCPASMVPVASMVPEIMTGMGWPSSSRKRSMATSAGLDVARILAGFKQQQIRAAFHQSAWPVRKSCRPVPGTSRRRSRRWPSWWDPWRRRRNAAWPWWRIRRQPGAPAAPLQCSTRMRRFPGHTPPTRSWLPPKELVSRISTPAAKYAR